MKKGVSLISLIITIVVIIILASIAIFSSLNTIDESQTVKRQAEFEEVCTFVRQISSRVEAGLYDLNLNSETLITAEKLKDFYAPSGELSAEEQNRIHSLNEARKDNPNLGYHFVKGKDIENDVIPGLSGISSSEYNFTTPSRVDNDYIINFTYGTVVARITPNKTLIRGTVR